MSRQNPRARRLRRGGEEIGCVCNLRIPLNEANPEKPRSLGAVTVFHRTNAALSDSVPALKLTSHVGNRQMQVDGICFSLIPMRKVSCDLPSLVATCDNRKGADNYCRSSDLEEQPEVAVVCPKNLNQ
jgi:hypothetical protein